MQPWPGVLLASAVAASGHVVTFLIAARTAGVNATPLRLLPLALIVLVGAGLPSIAGWGPREGVAAWAFGTAGLGPAQGVAVAVVYGVMVLVATLPGAIFLVAAGLGRGAGVAGPGMEQPAVSASAVDSGRHG